MSTSEIMEPQDGEMSCPTRLALPAAGGAGEAAALAHEEQVELEKQAVRPARG